MFLFKKKRIKSLCCAAIALIVMSNHLSGAEHNKNTQSGIRHINPSAENGVGSIEMAIQSALDTNPEILFQKAEREATRHKITQARGNFLPSISIRAGAGREYVKQNFRQSTGSATGLSSLSRGSNNQARYDPSIRLTQRIFDGTRSIKEFEKSKNEFAQSTKNVAEAQTLVAFSVFDAYVAVRRFERLYRLAKENVRVHESILSKVRKLVNAGNATASDEESVRSRLFDAKAALGDIEGDLLGAYANFKEITGKEAKDLSQPILSESQIPGTMQEAIQLARSQNKSVQVAQATEKVSKSEFDGSISPFMPSFDLELEARRNFNVAGKEGHETTLTGQVVGTFNVFNGGKDIGRRRELRALLAGSKYQTQRELRRAEKEVRVSYAEMVSARKQSSALKSAVNAKQKVRDSFMKQFEAGTRSFVDILDASHEFFLAKGSMITADATGDVAVARLYSAMGIILSVYKNLSIKTDMRHLGYGDSPRGKTVHNVSAKSSATGSSKSSQSQYNAYY